MIMQPGLKIMKTHSSSFIALAMTAKSNIKEIDIDMLKQQLQSPQAPILIDVREDTEWQSGHLPDAIHLSKGILERDVEKVIPDPQTPIVLYCSGGYRSALAADNLQKMGYKHVYSLLGGSSAWVNAGYPLENS